MVKLALGDGIGFRKHPRALAEKVDTPLVGQPVEVQSVSVFIKVFKEMRQ